MQRRTSAAAAPRRAFTLVELLVVIIIIAILAALAVPAVMRATVTAQNARIKTEIDMLHQAIMQYKNEYGSFPPCVDFPAGALNKHLNRLFPRATTGFTPAEANLVQPDTAIVTWLSGFNTDNPAAPLSGNKKRLFDFDAARVSGLRFTAPSKPASPYIYIDSAHYKDFPYLATAPANPGAHFDPPRPLPSPPAGATVAWYSTNVLFPNAPQQSFSNVDTFQILSAGRDEKFGTDDDMSNFWPGTRKDYLDSLK